MKTQFEKCLTKTCFFKIKLMYILLCKKNLAKKKRDSFCNEKNDIIIIIIITINMESNNERVEVKKL